MTPLWWAAVEGLTAGEVLAYRAALPASARVEFTARLRRALTVALSKGKETP